MRFIPVRVTNEVKSRYPDRSTVYAKIDDRFFEWASTRSWYLKQSSSEVYVVCDGPSRIIDGKRVWSPRRLRLHREIYRRIHGHAPSRIDHKDHDTLNNTGKNLRDGSNGLNEANRRANKNNRSGYKGVSFNKQCNKWAVRIKNKHVGLFSSLEEAARAYDQAAIALWGEFAYTNFPRSEYMVAA